MQLNILHSMHSLTDTELKPHIVLIRSVVQPCTVHYIECKNSSRRVRGHAETMLNLENLPYLLHETSKWFHGRNSNETKEWRVGIIQSKHRVPAAIKVDIKTLSDSEVSYCFCIYIQLLRTMLILVKVEPSSQRVWKIPPENKAIKRVAYFAKSLDKIIWTLPVVRDN